jgi:hypothetical protein
MLEVAFLVALAKRDTGGAAALSRLGEDGGRGHPGVHRDGLGRVAESATAASTAAARTKPLSEARYPHFVDLQGLRRRMPLVAFVLLAAICLLLIGLACACLSDQPAKAAERAVSVPALAVPFVEMWPALLLALAATGALILVAVALPRERASPAALQRFLF